MTRLLIITTVLLIWSSFYLKAQKIDFVEEHASLEKVIEDLRARDFSVYSDSIVTKSNHLISVRCVNEEIETVLAKIFIDQPFSYELIKKSILLTYKHTNISESTSKQLGATGTKPLSGTIRNISGDGLAGATIQIKGLQGKGAKTDGNGNFHIDNAPLSGTLLVSYVGYENNEITYQRQSIFNIVLVPEQNILNEQTVKKGNYDVSQLLNTGAVSNIQVRDNVDQPVSDLLMALQGRATGIYIAQNSGVPGAALNVNIRGLNSMANGNLPLYIIDGVPYCTPSFSNTLYAPVPISPFNVIRPEDVESVTILKDADATAIYGSRGANGVILITTRKTGPGPTKVDVNVQSGFNTPSRKLNLMNTPQYLAMRREALKNDNSGLRSDDYDINGTWDAKRQTNWQDELFGARATLNNAHVRISAGNENTQFWVAGKYREEKSITRPGEFFGRTRSFGGSIFHQSDNRRLEIRLGADYSYLKFVLPQTEYYKNVFAASNGPAALRQGGEINWVDWTDFNPAAETRRISETTLDNLMSYFKAKYRIFSGLYLVNNIGYTATRFREIALTPAASFPLSPGNSNLLRTKKTATNEIMTWLYEPQINYNKVFNSNHVLDVTAGATFQESINNRTRLDAVGFDTDEMIMNVGAASNLTGWQDNTKYSYNALFARFGYTAYGRYVLNFTGRRDGSSRLAPNKRFGNFGAIGAAWVFTEEKFIKRALPYLTMGKIKGSYGITGNDQIQDYQYVNRYNVSFGMGTNSGLIPVQLTNESFGWEVIKKSQLGIELYFPIQVSVEANYYRHLTTKQLVESSVSGTTGYNSIITNIPAEVENKGFEFELHSQNIKRKSFTWQSNFNISFPKNTLLSYPGFEGSVYATKYAIGHSMNMRYMYDYNGVNRETGLYTFRQHQEDNVLNQYDKVPTFIGQKFFGGLGNTITYKGIGLELFIQFVNQTGYQYGGLTTPGQNFKGGSNQPAMFLNHWQKPGDIAQHQKYSSTDEARISYEQYQESNAVVTDASFIRLKNVSLSYTLSNAVIQKLKIKQARFYIQGQNLLLITPFKNGDPETARPMLPTAQPPLRTVVAGCNLTF
jgi:TonB-linked SusC/RagA family outer membrane protein